MESMIRTERSAWLDIAKGITIILMVLGHTSLPIKVSNFIFAFHMPLFFIASGFVSNYAKTGFGVYVKKKIRDLLLPFFVYSLLLFALLKASCNVQILNLLRNGWGGTHSGSYRSSSLPLCLCELRSC